MTLVVAIVIIYMIAMLLIGYWSSKQISSNTDFLLAGRRLGPLLMAGTLAATEIGGGSSLGVVQNAYGSWGASAAWYIIAMGVAFIILMFIAPKFRAAEVKTVPEFFRRRYSKASGAVSGVIMVLALIGLTAGQLTASATIISTMLGISYNFALIVISIIITIYAVMGGLWSVTITDFIQVFLIIVGMAVSIPFVLSMAGGWGNVVANIPTEHLSLTQGIGGWGQIIGYIIMYLATFTVGQEAVSRYYAARDGKAATQGSLIAAIINFLFAFVPVVLGLSLLAMYNTGSLDASVVESLNTSPRYALPQLAVVALPSVICGILFAGIISATMSSADSDMLGAGSIFANDIYKQYIKKDASQTELMHCTQITMILVAVFSCVCALFANNILTLLAFSFTLRAAGTFFPYVLGHYWKKASAAGCLASIIIASVVFFLMDYGYIPSVPGLNNIIPALIVSLVVFVGVSLAVPPAEESLELKPEED